MIQELIKIRHYLHSKPELSKHEKETSAYILNFLKDTKPDNIITNIGGHGIIAFYKGAKPGKTIAVRADIDALPIEESNTFEYKSTNQGVSHACGHDGHIAIALGLARIVSGQRNYLHGTTAILFQPAEETGTGANDMLQDGKMEDIHFDYIIALHNLPGFEKNALIVRKGIFASSSIGVKIRLYGNTSHAGHPELGNSPVRAMTALIDALNSLPQTCTPLHRAALVTVIHARLGEIAFGTTPGFAQVMGTLRSHHDQDIKKMSHKLEEITKGIASAYYLEHEMEWVEYFPALENTPQCVDVIKEAGEKFNLPIVERDHPFSWSEDFAYFTKPYKGCLFGIGAGINHAPVHKGNYDFPDDLIETGLKVLQEIIKTLPSD